jgi:ssRNA-specific RNase YbeY (16S rRNA maturation enzyme)
LEIEITNNVHWLAFNEKEVGLLDAIWDKLKKCQVKPSTLSITFLDEKEICKDNKKF